MQPYQLDSGFPQWLTGWQGFTSRGHGNPVPSMLSMCVSNITNKDSSLHTLVDNSPNTSPPLNSNLLYTSHHLHLEPLHTSPPSKWHKLQHPPKYSPRELDKLAQTFAQELHRLGWYKFFHQHFSHNYYFLNIYSAIYLIYLPLFSISSHLWGYLHHQQYPHGHSHNKMLRSSRARIHPPVTNIPPSC